MPPPFVIGSSHLNAVWQAAVEQQMLLDSVQLWATPFQRDGESLALPPEVEERLRAPAFSLIGGGAAIALGVPAHPQPFDFVLPDAPELPLVEGAQVVPYDAVRASLQALERNSLEELSLLARKVSPLYHFEPPPPLWDEKPCDDPLWVRLMGELTAISPPYLRLKVWRAQSDLVAELCAACGVTYVGHPVEASDAGGFLKPEFAGFYPAHGNTAYGALVFEQIKALAAVDAAA